MIVNELTLPKSSKTTLIYRLLHLLILMEPKGTIVFTTVGRPYYGFDIFSVGLPSNFTGFDVIPDEQRLTDSVSVNYNGQFVDDDDQNLLVFVSERTGSSRVYLNTTSTKPPRILPSATSSLFHDRPIIKNRRLYFISAHEPADIPFKSWSALYSMELDDDTSSDGVPRRLTPSGCVDYSPALSQSGKLIAVASYGSRPWAGEFHSLQTDIVVFPESDPTNRLVVCQKGGWPTWSGDSTIYFHRQADDGWWSIFCLHLPATTDPDDNTQISPRRVTPPGLHCFTPAAMHNRPQIAIATRRPGNNYRHIEIFDVESQEFYPVTKLLNFQFHHYNPFVSPESGFLGYHRFRGESAGCGESIIPHLDPVSSPIKSLRMLRLNGSFPSFSPDGVLIAFNRDFDSNPGVKIVKSDGSKRWTLLGGRTAFYNSWSPAGNNVIFTSIGSVFESVKATVQVARISFDPADFSLNEDDIQEVDVKILTSEGTGNNAFPSCSPDGKSLVFRSGRSGHKNLYIMDAVDGEFNGGIRQLTEGSWIDTMPSWSPDGKLIAFSSNRHNPDNVDAFSIYFIRPDGTDVRRIYVAGPEGSEAVDRERINHVCFSEDGEWLLFAANLGGVTAEPVSLPNQFQPYGDLHVARLDGSGLRRLTCNGYENGTPAWYPGDESDLGRLRLDCDGGDKLSGQFDDPLWIH